MCRLQNDVLIVNNQRKALYDVVGIYILTVVNIFIIQNKGVFQVGPSLDDGCPPSNSTQKTDGCGVGHDGVGHDSYCVSDVITHDNQLHVSSAA